jgi:cellulose synthase/poly-beta-1,6-N-acetylglucosamine synthase-like glycosyltransferase
VLDADYVVKPNWLKDLLPLFADPKVSMIQAPQDHRDGPRTAMHQAMNGEYAASSTSAWCSERKERHHRPAPCASFAARRWCGRQLVERHDLRTPISA